jgi:hypothetical protein
VVVGRSKKRSTNTGYRGKDRPTTEKARRASVRVRERPELLPLTEDEARQPLSPCDGPSPLRR